MKVLHVINDLRIGGAEHLVADLLPLLKSKGIQSDLLLLNGEVNDYGPVLEKEGIKVFYNTLSQRDPRQIMGIRKIARDYDIVHAHLFPSVYWASLALRFGMKAKFLLTEHSTHNRRRDHVLLRPVEKFIYSRCNALIAISEGTRKNLLAWMKPGDESLVCTISNGVDLKAFDRAPACDRSDFFPGDSFILAMVGNLTFKKDQATIIRALPLLPDKVKLLLIGEGQERDKLEKLISQKGLEARVKLLGARKDAPSILKSADAAVVSSHWEGFGLAAVEGMAAGLPVLASRVEGLESVVGKKGLLFTGGDETELAGLVSRLLEEPDFYKTVKTLCSARAAKFSLTAMAKGYIDLYGRLMSKPGEKPL